MHRFVVPPVLLWTTIIVATSSTATPITIDTVPVGNAGNAGDASGGGIGTFGSVSYDYRIGATEVTNAQYAEFLNAKAASDPLGLYNPEMDSSLYGGITRSGSDGSYTYAVKPNMGNKPVNHVSWYDAIRFANWLHNGQGTGDTETGAYTLGALAPDGVPLSGSSISRKADATWWLPNENEWYKAAYYDPTIDGGAGGYWDYPMRSNIDETPTMATANSVGDVSNPGFNVANYAIGADWNGAIGNVTTVGSAGPLSASFYETFDQGGNVAEWNEALIDGVNRGVRGGGSFNIASDLWATTRKNSIPTEENSVFGFRVATVHEVIVPEPSTGVLAAVGFVFVLGLNRRRK